jgi:hypothetical protein
MDEGEYDVIFFNNCYFCPSYIVRGVTGDGCKSNESGICSPVTCPFIFWLKVQKGDI